MARGGMMPTLWNPGHASVLETGIFYRQDDMDIIGPYNADRVAAAVRAYYLFWASLRGVSPLGFRLGKPY